MNKAYYCNSILLALFCVQLQAQENELPSIAFLEYLAEMKEVDGKFYGPQDIDIAPCLLPKQKQEELPHEIENNINDKENVQAKKGKSSANALECKPHD